MKSEIAGEEFLRRTLLGLVLAGLAVTLAWFALPWTYQELKCLRHVHLAQQAIQREDWVFAGQSLSLALNLRPNHLAALKNMARVARHFDSPAALGLQLRVVQLQPGRFDNEHLLALDALRCDALPIAEDFVNRWQLAQSDRVELCNVLSLLALKKGDLPAAERAARKAVDAARANPSLKLTLLNLLLLQDASEKTPGVSELIQSLLVDHTTRPGALRSLISSAQRHAEYDKAVGYSQQLIGLPRALFKDHLIHLRLLRRAESADWPACLAALQQTALAEPRQALHLANELLAQGDAPACLAFLERIPGEQRSQNSFQLIETEALDRLERWQDLTDRLQPGDWGYLEALRLAYLSKAYRKLDKDSLFEVTCQQIAPRLREHPELLPLVTSLTSKWDGWNTETLNFLWMALDQGEHAEWAFSALTKHFYSTGDTVELLQLTHKMHRLQPTSAVVRNNLVMFSLLLGKDLPNAHRVARELHEEQPDSPSILSTYCFSLHCQGNTREALERLGRLDPELLRQPAFAAYHFLFLVEAGQSQQARAVWPLAASATLLPEEQKLLTAAKLKLNI